MSTPCEPSSPKSIVAAGYDRIAERYAEWAAHVQDVGRARLTAFLLDRLPPGARVLELGCGSGVLTTPLLTERFDLTGVDISARQIELARRRLPEATFIRGDITQIAFDDEAFDAVVAYYVFNHLPREELPTVLVRIARWLKTGGIFGGVFGAVDLEGEVEPDWLGAPMYFSQYDAAENVRLVEAAGLRIVSAEVEPTN